MASGNSKAFKFVRTLEFMFIRNIAFFVTHLNEWRKNIFWNKNLLDLQFSEVEVDCCK